MTPLERAGYIAHSMSRAYQSKLAKTQAQVASHPDYAVSISWGKDSVVLLHLSAQIHSDLVALHGRYTNPNEHIDDADRVRNLMFAREDMAHVDYSEIDIAGEWEMFERAGGAFNIAETEQQKAALKWWTARKWSGKAQTAVQEHHRNGSFVGMRQEESHARRMNIAKRGNDYQKKDGVNICLPLAHWTGKDIWAYIVTHDLPYLILYDQTMHGREKARSEFIFGGVAADAVKRHGAWEDWRRIYPKEFNAWLDKFPELDR